MKVVAISTSHHHQQNATVLALTATAPSYLTFDLEQILNKSFHIVKTTIKWLTILPTKA
jgi:superfamily II DNA helicase RecQ